MARTPVPMPQMGESIAEGTVSVWLKKVGEKVERDEPLLEIATDKVDAEIPSPAAGVLAEIAVQEGETVEVGTVVAYIETDVTAGVAAGAAQAPPREEATAEAAPQPETASTAAAQPSAAAPPARAAAPPEPPEAAGDGDGAESLAERLRTRSSPLVRRIAAEHGVDLASLSGSGRMGRVTKEDILEHIERVAAEPAVAAGGNGHRRAPRKPAPGGGITWDDFYTEVEHPEIETAPGDRVQPMSRMTRLIADHMVLSRRTSAHVHSYFEIDYSRVDQLRAAHRQTWEEQGVKVSYTAFIARAVATALREQPTINASVSGRNVVHHPNVNLGIAVALPWGLIVPVVERADELSLVGLARRIADLAERARAKKLAPEEVQGGTFTITNPGIFGTTIGFPIINQPQVAILGVGAIEKRPAVITDEFGNDAIVARKRGYLALGYDHRLVNGADGDRFLARVKEILETFPDDAA